MPLSTTTSLSPQIHVRFVSYSKVATRGNYILCSPCPSSVICNNHRISAAIGSLLPTNYTAESYRSIFTNSYYEKKNFKLDALPFTVSPREALYGFYTWAKEEQGLGSYILDQSSVKLGAAYAPVWSFDVNIRFATTSSPSSSSFYKIKKRYDLKPKPFQDAFGPNQKTIHLPGLSTYAGYTFRRSLVNPILDTSLLFLGDKTVPFQSWMLRNMQWDLNGEEIEIFPDPWNATRGRAFNVLEEELRSMAKGVEDEIGEDGTTCEVETQILSSRRVYMPIFFIDYKVLGVEYRAFVSGCDAGSGVSGVSHQVFTGGPSVVSASHSFLQGVEIARRTIGDIPLITLINNFLRLALKSLSRFHVIGIVGGGMYVAFRKLIKPWIDDRSESAEWERQRENEAYMSGDSRWDHADDFVDDGSARRYFLRNKKRILRHLSGEVEHEEGDFDWYKKWEEWARKQWEEEQTQQSSRQRDEWWNQQQQQRQQSYRKQQQQQQQQQQQRAQPGKKKKTYEWDFDPNDPYSVLGIQRSGALTKSDVSKAFRREMLKHHPDTQAGATAEEKDRSVERSKLITEAYRKIKSQMK